MKHNIDVEDYKTSDFNIEENKSQIQWNVNELKIANAAPAYITSFNTINTEIYSDWWVCIGNSKFANTLKFRAIKGTVPNVFHRFMQKWILGIEWKRDGYE